MEIIQDLIHFILHANDALKDIIHDYGTLTYLILFAIIFCETGLVVTPFLPGDSLLFAAGAIAAQPDSLNIWLLIAILFVSAFTGNLTNYGIGRWIGPVVYEKNYKLIKRKYLDQAKAYFEKHGALTIVYTRFAPFLRTFAPFVAGVGQMRYGTFMLYNFIGGAAWIITFCFAGYFFGTVPFVQKHFEIVVLGIVAVSLIPAVLAFMKARKDGKEKA